MAIPKIIHYCWLSNDPVPEKLQHYMITWKNHLPDYELIKWDFSRFDINTSVWVREAFESKKYAFAADYIRIYALYTMGGIYLDMDVEILKSFDDLLNRREILGYESGSGKPEVAAFGTEKGCEWLKPCLDYYKDRHFIKKDGSYDNKTLPKIVFDIIREHGYAFYPCEDIYCIAPNNCIAILPSDFFSPKSYKTGKIQKTANTYSIHHFSGSWVPLNERIEHRFWHFLGIKPHRVMWHLNQWLQKHKL